MSMKVEKHNFTYGQKINFNERRFWGKVQICTRVGCIH